MLSVAGILTAQAKLNIIALLDTPKTPDDIAEKLKITRQGVDKQIKELLAYGIVEKRWFIGYNRPKVEFYLTELGSQLYRDIEELLKNFRMSGQNAVNERLRVLDLELLDGKIATEKYRKEKEEIETTLKWFLD